MPFNFPLALPMIDTGVPLSPAHGTVNKMFYSSLLGGLSEVFALLHFASRPNRPEILHTIDAVNTSHGTLEGGWIFQIAFHQFDTLVGLLLGRITTALTSQRSQPPSSR